MIIDKLFFWSAIIGGVLFLAQVVLSVIGWTSGGGVHVDVDASGGHDLGGGHDVGGDHSAADTSFKILSLQGMSAFTMMFGLVGLAMRTDSGLGPLVSLIGAVGAGVLATWVISRIFRLFVRLQSTGNVDMHKAVGAKGTVYLTIERSKPGKVQIVVAGRLMTLDASTEEDETLATGDAVQVVRVTREQQLIVAKAPALEYGAE